MTIRKIRDFHTFKKTQDRWNRFLFFSGIDCVFLTHEWFESWWRSFGEDFSMEILWFEDSNHRPYGIAPLMVDRDRVCFLASKEVSDYCDFLLSPKKEERERFFENLLHYFIQNHSGKKIELLNIPQSSFTLSFLDSLSSRTPMSCSQRESEVTPVLKLPSSYQEFLQNLDKKNRHELRRKLRRIDSLPDARTETWREPQKMAGMVSQFIQLHREGSQEKEEFWKKKGMEDFFKDLCSRFSSRGWIEGETLFKGKELLSILITFSYSGRIYFYNGAFNRRYSRYSPGIYLFHRSIQKAISEGRKEVNFLRGKESYKYEFGSGEHRIFDLTLTPEK
ncbi:GNAT family N-acetyltransferase [bacterium]|nr:GNAT family N-acetyltransferase [bacterium]